MIDTHGLKMTGLKEASAATKGLNGPYTPEYVQISYDMEKGEVLNDYHYSLGQNSWIEYRDPNIIRVCNLQEHTSMQDIADLIFWRVDELKKTEQYLAEHYPEPELDDCEPELD